MNKNEFLRSLEAINITLTEDEISKFEQYKELLQEYNKNFNLTSLVEDKDIYLKHFYDSLYLLTLNEVCESRSILDIGTGAGFPGIPLAICLKNANVVLVESNAKKCGFLKIVCEKLGLKNVEVVNLRAEEYVKNHIEEFDVVTSRAVSHLVVLLELEIPALKVSGYFIPLKGKILEELKESQDTLKKLSCEINEIIDYTLPIEESKRTIIKIRKKEKTDNIYPRDYSKIIKDLKKKLK